MVGYLIIGLIVIVSVIVVLALYFARPIALALLLDMWDLILPKGSKLQPDHSINSVERLDTFIAEQFSTHGIPGAAVAIVANGHVAWSKGYGYAHIEKQIPATADTPFGLGSISKTFIAVSLMQAIEDGCLTLDTDINDVLSFRVVNPRSVNLHRVNPRTAESIITLRHLVTHTSGIKDHPWTYNVRSYRHGDPTTPLGKFLYAYLVPGGKWFRKRGNFLSTLPGEAHEYSNIASALAAYVIEEAVGEPFEQFTRRRIFEPLQMDNTGWFLQDFSTDTTVAMPYNRLNRPYGYLGIASWPDGQLRASANDLGRYLVTIMNGGLIEERRILHADSVREMLNPPLPSLEVEDDEEQGVFWGREGPLIGHNGGDPGVFTLMFFDPERALGAVVLTNSLTRRSTKAAANILRQILRGDGTAAMFAMD